MKNTNELHSAAIMQGSQQSGGKGSDIEHKVTYKRISSLFRIFMTLSLLELALYGQDLEMHQVSARQFFGWVGTMLPNTIV